MTESIMCSTFVKTNQNTSNSLYKIQNSLIAKNALWPQNKTLRIAFADGVDKKYADIFRDIVETHYKPVIGLGMEWGVSDNADITVQFNERLKLESAIGSDYTYINEKKCDNCSLTIPTTVMQSLRNDDNIYQGHVLHEFGHALGLLHEMQNPNIDWIKENVINDFINQGVLVAGDDYNNNIWFESEFKPMVMYGSSAFGSSEYDPRSIMTYSFGSSTNKQGLTVKQPNVLSENDKEYLRKIYPKFLKTGYDEENNTNSITDSVDTNLISFSIPTSTVYIPNFYDSLSTWNWWLAASIFCLIASVVVIIIVTLRLVRKNNRYTSINPKIKLSSENQF